MALEKETELELLQAERQRLLSEIDELQSKLTDELQAKLTSEIDTNREDNLIRAFERQQYLLADMMRDHRETMQRTADVSVSRTSSKIQFWAGLGTFIAICWTIWSFSQDFNDQNVEIAEIKVKTERIEIIEADVKKNTQLITEVGRDVKYLLGEERVIGDSTLSEEHLVLTSTTTD